MLVAADSNLFGYDTITEDIASLLLKEGARADIVDNVSVIHVHVV